MARDWQSLSHPHFDLLPSSTTMQAGYIVASYKHCGIAVNSTYVIAAGVEKVTLDTRYKQSLSAEDHNGVIRRYNQSIVF